MSGEILFLAHRLPFPPDRGDRIRSTHILRALAQIAPVHVGCFVDSVADRAHLPELADLCASTCVEMRQTSLPMLTCSVAVRGCNCPGSMTTMSRVLMNRLVAKTKRELRISTS